MKHEEGTKSARVAYQYIIERSHINHIMPIAPRYHNKRGHGCFLPDVLVYWDLCNLVGHRLERRRKKAASAGRTEAAERNETAVTVKLCSSVFYTERKEMTRVRLLDICDLVLAANHQFDVNHIDAACGLDVGKWDMEVRIHERILEDDYKYYRYTTEGTTNGIHDPDFTKAEAHIKRLMEAKP